MRAPTDHRVSIVIDGFEVRGWESYAITSSIVDPVDTFELAMPFDRKAWDLMRTDRPVRVMIDGICILDGFLDESPLPETEEVLHVRGRDRVGRLVQESAPGFRYRGLKLTDLVAQLASPWFTKVTLSNARNRRVLRGRGRKAAAADEPVKLSPRKDGLAVEPGQMRWAVIEELLGQAGLLAWSAGDGKELVVGKPNYAQEVQWRFFHPAAGSSRGREGNVLSMGIGRSTADRYSRVIVVGSGRGTNANYGAAVSSRFGEARDNPSDPEGVGGDFSAPKRLVLQEPVQSTAEAQALAERELRRRAAQGHPITVTAPLHGQLVGGAALTVFTPDTLAAVEDERTGTRGVYLVTSCTYKSSRQGGEQTSMNLVPKGTELAA